MRDNASLNPALFLAQLVLLELTLSIYIYSESQVTIIRAS